MSGISGEGGKFAVIQTLASHAGSIKLYQCVGGIEKFCLTVSNSNCIIEFIPGIIGLHYFLPILVPTQHCLLDYAKNSGIYFSLL